MPRAVPTLTPREHEVAALVAAGKSNREIAAALVLSERHADKVRVISRAALARYPLEPVSTSAMVAISTRIPTGLAR